MIKTELSFQDLYCLNLTRLMSFYRSMNATCVKQLGDHGSKEVYRDPIFQHLLCKFIVFMRRGSELEQALIS